ncbi:MAG TPA: Gfo/Idh/MocA family oxidoreductase [Gemmataceae bacterium]|jgi:predicted dehydrogenase
MPASTRREFLQTTATTAAAATMFAGGVHAAGSDTVRIGLIGCGARGRGAAEQALAADPSARTKLVAIGDAFADQIESNISVIGRNDKNIAKRVDVPPERRFVGLDAYKHVIEASDVVLLATPPGFRPIHLQAAVDAGKHVFMEKPVAVDAPGVRKVMAACEQAKTKGLSVVCGLQQRYDHPRPDAVKRIHDGMIGDVLAVKSAWIGNMPAKKFPMPRKPEWSDMEWQVRNWYWWTWLSGDHIVEQAIHSIDKGTWVLGDKPPVAAVGLGGLQSRMVSDQEQILDPQRGQIFDHHAVIYEYPNERRHFHYCRQVKNSHNDQTTHVFGTKGVCILERGVIHDLAGKEVWRYRGEKPDPYQVEHDVLFAAIRNGKPVNQGDYVARTTMIAIMGRMADYTGQRVTWEQAFNSKQDLSPPRYEWGPLPTPKMAIPGTTKVV